MGIKGIYQEIGPGERIALQKLAVETYEAKGRPLRLAIDISIWLFQIQSGKGGTNPALRTFYYRLLRLIAFSIHPLFVFDGPNKPPFKRDKRTGPNVASIPDFLAKQLLKKFAIPFHIAPGEAEAECALLQQKGLVDAVLSEDVDTLMFGCGRTLRTWSPEPGTGSQTRTHVNLYDADRTKAGKSGLDRPGMILVAMMSGGDYLPEGIPGCGPKTACEAARAGFGADLCSLAKRDRAGIAAWRARLCHELKTNESKYFTRKHKALVVPEEFPRKDILGYYTMPVISTDTQVEVLRQALSWDQPLDINGLRSFCGEAFDWVCISGAKKFIRNIAPCLLVKELRLRAELDTPSDLEAVKEAEGRLVRGIHGKRCHKSTDGSPEMRISFTPLDLVKLDLEAEDPDPEIATVDSDAEEEEAGNIEVGDEVSSPKKRAPSNYDPAQLEKLWILESFVKSGVPLLTEDYEETCRRNDAAKMAKEVAKAHRQAARQAATTLATKKWTATTGGMQRGALDRYTRVTKPGNSLSQPPFPDKTGQISLDDPFQATRPVSPNGKSTDQLSARAVPIFCPSGPSNGIVSPAKQAVPVFIDLLSSPERATTRRKRSIQRTLSETKSGTSQSSVHETDLSPHLPTSVKIRRPRTPLRRTQTLPNSYAVGSQALVPETFPSHHKAIAPTLDNVSYRLPDQSQDSSQMGTQESTKVDSGQPGAGVISISSSPVSIHGQGSITASASPSKQRIVEGSNATVTALDFSSIYDDDEILDLDFRSKLLPSVTQITHSDVKTANPSGHPRSTQKRSVRIRQSLEGSWVYEVPKDPHTTPEAKRNKSSQRVFRLNHVAVLDMTNDD